MGRSDVPVQHALIILEGFPTCLTERDCFFQRPVRQNPDLPPKLDEIINKCLEKDRNLRYQHAADIRTDLQRLKRDTAWGSHGLSINARVQYGVDASFACGAGTLSERAGCSLPPRSFPSASRTLSVAATYKACRRFEKPNWCCRDLILPSLFEPTR
jgi:hypothetical protein